MQNINITEDQTVYYNTKASDRTAIFRETQVKYRQTRSSFKDNLNCRMHTANPAEKSWHAQKEKNLSPFWSRDKYATPQLESKPAALKIVFLKLINMSVWIFNAELKL